MSAGREGRFPQKRYSKESKSDSSKQPLHSNRINLPTTLRPDTRLRERVHRSAPHCGRCYNLSTLVSDAYYQQHAASRELSETICCDDRTHSYVQKQLMRAEFVRLCRMLALHKLRSSSYYLYQNLTTDPMLHRLR